MLTSLPRRVRRLSLAAAFGAVVIGLGPTPAYAQTDPDLIPILTRAIMLPATADPTLSRIAIDPESSAAIVTTAGGSRGEFKLSVKVTALTFLNFTLSTPAKSGRAQIVLGDELPTGTKVEISGSHVYWFTDPVKLNALTKEALQRLPASREEALQRIVAEASKDAVGLVITPGADYGREKFDFREDGTGINRTGQLRESWGGSFAIGVMIYREKQSYPTYVGFTSRRGQSWEARASLSECTATDRSTLLSCQSVVVGEPKPINKKSIGFEVRQRFAKDFGWVPQVTYDLAQEKGHRWKAEFPLYLVGTVINKEFNLTGGFALGYKEGSGGYAAVFVGPTFPFLPGVNRATDDQVLHGQSR